MPCRDKTHTTGLYLATFNCGIIASYREILKSESLKQTAIFMLDTFEDSITKPLAIVYDNGCNIKKFISNTKNIKSKTSRLDDFLNLPIAVDRFHFNDHVDDWCKINCDPNMFDCLKGLNTSSCEETNFWLSRFKHMNLPKFAFFIYTILNEYNTAKLFMKLDFLKPYKVD